MKPKVFVTRELPKIALDRLSAECEMELNQEDWVLTKQEIIAGVKGKEGLLCLLTDTINAEIMDAAAGGLKIIANYAVGYNNIDVPAATQRKIPVTNTPGVLTETTADLAWALLMSVARRVVESDKFLRAGKFHGWAPLMFLGNDIYGKTLGIIGFGRIGAAMARRARGFGMRVISYDRTPSAKVNEFGVEFVDLDGLLKEADFISVHVPLTPENQHLIS